MKTIIVARRFGRLANRLSLASNLVAIGCEVGCRVVNSTLQPYAAAFENLNDNFYCTFPRPPRPGLIDRVPPLANALRSGRASQRLTTLSRRLIRPFPIAAVAHIEQGRGGISSHRPNALLAHLAAQPVRVVFVRDWYIRAPDLVIRHAPAIREFFRPVAAVASRAEAPVRRLRARADIVIGVHIRHGDYARFQGGRYFFAPERYAAWMSELVGAFAPARVGFLICSDGDVPPEPFAHMAVEYGPGDAAGDLFALAACDRVIGPASTYSQWAAFYGDIPHCCVADDGVALTPDRFTACDLSAIP